MLRHIDFHKKIWMAIALASFVVAFIGVVRVEIYNELVEPKIIPGAYGQDLITLAVSIVLFVLAIKATAESTKIHLIVVGLLGFLFYAYGLYTIEQVYNYLYLVYLAIFATVFWEIVHIHLTQNWQYATHEKFTPTKKLFSVAVAYFQPVVFVPLWTFALIGLMNKGDRIENLFSVYILDLVFIMPAFLIIAIAMQREKVMGYVLAVPMFVLGFVLIFSLGVSELAKPIFDREIAVGALVMSASLSLVFLVAAIVHVRSLKLHYDDIR